MEHEWPGMGAGTPQFTYTPGIDLTDEGVVGEGMPQGPGGSNYAGEGNQQGPGGSNSVAECMEQAARGKRSRTKGVSTRSLNFNASEDETLCSAYLNICKDPIVGVNQSHGGYWDRIKEYFDLHKKTKHPRTKSSLQHRWGDIQKDTSRFCGFYDELEKKKQSGKSEDDMVKDAIQLFDGVVGTGFKFLHCWLILRNEAKWNAWLAAMNGNDGTEPTETYVAGTDHPGTDPTLPPKMERPIGRDRAKKQRSSSSSSSACLEVLQKMSMDNFAFAERQDAANKEEATETASRSDRKLAVQEELVQIQRVQVELQRETLKLHKEESEDRVMSMDVEKMAPWVRQYYINKQKKIAQRSLHGDSSTGQGGV